MSAEEPFVTRIPRRPKYTRISGKKQEGTTEKDVCFVSGIYQRENCFSEY